MFLFLAKATLPKAWRSPTWAAVKKVLLEHYFARTIVRSNTDKGSSLSRNQSSLWTCKIWKIDFMNSINQIPTRKEKNPSICWDFSSSTPTWIHSHRFDVGYNWLKSWASFVRSLLMSVCSFSNKHIPVTKGNQTPEVRRVRQDDRKCGIWSWGNFQITFEWCSVNACACGVCVWVWLWTCCTSEGRLE